MLDLLNRIKPKTFTRKEKLNPKFRAAIRDMENIFKYNPNHPKHIAGKYLVSATPYHYILTNGALVFMVEVFTCKQYCGTHTSVYLNNYIRGRGVTFANGVKFQIKCFNEKDMDIAMEILPNVPVGLITYELVVNKPSDLPRWYRVMKEMKEYDESEIRSFRLGSFTHADYWK